MSAPNDDLHYVAAQGDILAVQTLLKDGRDPNSFDEISFTPLHHAAEHEHLHVIAVLLEGGANVNARDELRAGDTPLGHVASNCSLALAQSLIAAGADPTIRGWMQLCALDRAQMRKRGEGQQVYELLRETARNLHPA